MDAASISEKEWPTPLTAAQESLLWGTYNVFTGQGPSLLGLLACGHASLSALLGCILAPCVRISRAVSFTFLC